MSGFDPRDDAVPYPSPARAWWIVAVLTVAYTFSFIDRQILSLMVGPIRRDLGISDTQFSLLIGVSFALFYTVFGIALGRVADRMSRRGLVAWGMVVWSAMTVLCGAAGRFSTLLLARMGVGVGEAALSPGAYSIIADIFPPARRAQALSVYATGIYVGGGLASVIGGVLVQWTSADLITLPILGNVHPWQAVFVAVGLPGIVASLLLLTFREPARRGPGVDANGATVRVPIREVLAFIGANRRTFLCHNLGFGLMSMGGYSIIAWVPTMYIRHFGWSARDIGVSFGIMGAVAGIIGALTGGRLSTLLHQRGHVDADLRIGTLAAIGCFCCYAVFPLLPTGGAAFVPLTLAQFFSAFPWGVAAAALARVTPNPMRGQVSAIYLFALNFVGLGLGPTAVALFTDRVFRRDDAIHLSLLIVTTLAYGSGALLLRLGWRPMRASVAAVGAWRLRAEPARL